MWSLRQLAPVFLVVTGACTSSGVMPPDSPRTDTGAGQQAAAPNYALLIDAGSSASRLHVFEWRSAAADSVPEIQPAPATRAANEAAWQLVVDGGLSDYAADPEGAGESLAPLLEYARQQLAAAGVEPARATLHLKATAGMRLVPEPARSAIMADVRGALEASPFDFQAAEIISGAQEGLFGWISVNYLLGHLGRGPFTSVGALDLGGASTQITFMPLDRPESAGARFELGGTTYDIYSHSYLDFGQDVASSAVASRACFPKGYPIPEGTRGIPDGALGSGDFAACQTTIRGFLERPCEASRCSSMGAYQPPLYGDFLAFSGYGYVSSFFGLDPTMSLPELARRGTQYCATDWEQILRDRPAEGQRKYLPSYCFKAAYVVTLLTDGFGFALDTDRVVTAGQIQGADVSWVLGALLFELSGSAD